MKINCRYPPYVLLGDYFKVIWPLICSFFWPVLLISEIVHQDCTPPFGIFFFMFFCSGHQGSKAYSLWDGVIPNPSIGYDYRLIPTEDRKSVV